MSDVVLHRHREVWKQKPVLRQLYAEWYWDIVSWLVPGRTIAVGGGTGNLKEYVSGVYCTDIIRLPWLEGVTDAQRLGVPSGSLVDRVLFDVLVRIETV